MNTKKYLFYLANRGENPRCIVTDSNLNNANKSLIHYIRDNKITPECEFVFTPSDSNRYLHFCTYLFKFKRRYIVTMNGKIYNLSTAEFLTVCKTF